MATSPRTVGFAPVKWLLAAAVTAVVVAAAGGTAEARRAPACAKAGSTVTATKYARVFRQRGRTYACRYRTGRRFLLGGDTVHNVRIAGRYVGYSRVTGAAGRKITVRELRRGRIVHDARAAALPPSLITDLRLKRNGSVAWIAQIMPLDLPLLPPHLRGDPRPTYEVRKADRAGKALLDRSRDIVPGSLRIRRTAAYWVKAGQVYSATLR